MESSYIMWPCIQLIPIFINITVHFFVCGMQKYYLPFSYFCESCLSLVGWESYVIYICLFFFYRKRDLWTKKE